MNETCNRQILLASYPDGIPKESNFVLKRTGVAVPGSGQVLCKTRYLSLDPYMRSQIAGRHISGSVSPGDLMRGETVCEVIASCNPEFRAGQLVRCMGGWQEYCLQDSKDIAVVDPGIQPASLALSLLGMTGLTAWAGMVWQANVKAGDKVLIPAVTGGVGAAAAQFCRSRGAQVVGLAGGARKCEFARRELGVSDCIDRRQEDIAQRLDVLFPDGIDVYFDLVGGELLLLASERLGLYARVVLCGLMAEYNKPERNAGPPPGNWIRSRAVVSGLVVYDYESRRDEFITACLADLKAGKLRQREDVSEGIESAPAAFCRLMRGENFGKVIVTL